MNLGLFFLKSFRVKQTAKGYGALTSAGTKPDFVDLCRTETWLPTVLSPDPDGQLNMRTSSWNYSNRMNAILMSCVTTAEQTIKIIGKKNALALGVKGKQKC